MFYKNKKEAVSKTVCIHEWKLIDYSIDHVYAGQDIDVVHYYTIGCGKCNSTKSMDKYEYSHMKAIGLVNT